MGTDKDNDLSKAAELRWRAEERVQAKMAELRPPQTEEEKQRLVHELEVRQVELEMQNEELRQAREYAENIVETVREPLVVLNSGLKILTANHSFYDTFKVTPGETIGNFIYDLGNRQWDIPKLRVLFEDILPLETVFNGYEVEHDFPGIGRKIILLNARQIFRKDVGSHIILLAMEDITERKRLKTEIQDAREYAENIVETVREPLVVLNSNLRILTANHSFYDTFKVTPEETIGNFIYDLGNRQWDIPKLRDLLEKILPENKAFSGFEIEVKLPNIGRRVMILNARKIFLKEPYFRTKLKVAEHFDQLILLALEDITGRKKIEEDLETLNRELKATSLDREAAYNDMESFSYSVSHDLRAPLRVITGLSEIVLRKYYDKLDEKGKNILDLIKENTKLMDQLILALLDFSRAGRQDMKLDEIDMEKAVTLIAGGLKAMAPERNISLDIRKLLPAHGDFTLIHQVLTNLLSNAFKFTKDRDVASIEVGSRQEDGENIYYVKDNGAGFDMEYADKLFKVFQRLHSMKEFDGIGIGLSIVQRIIQRHGGRVWAEGKQGEGATFYFSLPVKGGPNS